MRFYPSIKANLDEIIPNNFDFAEKLTTRMIELSRQIEEWENSPPIQSCPFCNGEMLNITFYMDLTLHCPGLYNGWYSPSHWYADDLIPTAWECQSCGAFDHKPEGNTQYHWKRDNPSKSTKTLASLMFANIEIITEVIFANVTYQKYFFFKANDVWYTFGAGITKEDIVTRLNLEKPTGRIRISQAERTGKNGFVYLILADTGHYKIGCTTNIADRMNFFGVKLPFDFDVIHIFPADDMYGAENRLHSTFVDQRTNGEWFVLNQDQVNLITKVDRFQTGTFLVAT